MAHVLGQMHEQWIVHEGKEGDRNRRSPVKTNASLSLDCSWGYRMPSLPSTYHQGRSECICSVRAGAVPRPHLSHAAAKGGAIDLRVWQGRTDW
eukprot:scaffold69975_cov19-Tisochrysis_lutea.AAC.3